MGCTANTKTTHPAKGLDLNKSHLNIKCAVLGNASVGKSSITQRFISNRFSDVYDVTLGGVYFKKEVTLKSGEKAWLHIWDTGG
jgi:GTPase SAR1 family protein